MKIVRWGIIGCGEVTEVKSGPALAKATNSRLVAVMRRNGTLAQDYARRHGVPRWHDDADAIIEADDVDVVYVATTPDAHRDLVLRCAAAGKPVLVEKPMALDFAQCTDMVAACKAAGTPLWVAYYRRALPRFLAIRDIVHGGAIGDIRMVVCRQFKHAPTRPPEGPAPWRTDPRISGGGLFADTMSHTLDLLDFLLGPVAAVRAFAASTTGTARVEDVVSATLRLESGVLCNASVSYVADRDEEANEIIGSKGRVAFTVARPTPIRLTIGDSVQDFPIDDPPHIHQPLVQSIVDELNGLGACASTGATGARTNWVMDEVLREFRTAGLPDVDSTTEGASSRSR